MITLRPADLTAVTVSTFAGQPAATVWRHVYRGQLPDGSDGLRVALVIFYRHPSVPGRIGLIGQRVHDGYHQWILATFHNAARLALSCWAHDCDTTLEFVTPEEYAAQHGGVIPMPETLEESRTLYGDAHEFTVGTSRRVLRPRPTQDSS